MKYPPSPQGNFILGNTQQFKKNPLEFMVSSVKSLGDIISFRILTKRVYMISDAETARYIMQTNSKNYTKSPGYKPLRLLVGNGLFTSEGTFWLRQRRMYQPAFSNKSVENYSKNVIESSKEVISGWENSLEKNTSINATKDMAQLTLNIIGRSLFSTDLGKEAKHFFDPLTISLEYVNDRALRAPFVMPNWFPDSTNRKFRKAVSEIDKIVYDVIEERKKKDNWPDDLLTSLLTVKDDETEERLTPLQVRDECITLFLAGHESTANVLNWFFYLLTIHPEVQDMVHVELNKNLQGKIPVFNDLHQLPFLVQCINETMRLYPPIWHLGRMNINEDMIGDYKIKPKSHIRISPYTIQRNPKYWDEPDRFDPNRFSLENSKKHIPGSFIPFGNGPRLCIGRNFAMMEMTLILANFYQKYRIKVKNANEIKVLPLLVLRPDRDIILDLEKK